MFRQKEWVFTGNSGTEYRFTLFPKSKGLPPSGGVFILAYTHPRGHLAGWQVNPLLVGHAADMRQALEDEVRPDRDQGDVWNCTYALLESDAAIREDCARDLERLVPVSTGDTTPSNSENPD